MELNNPKRLAAKQCNADLRSAVSQTSSLQNLRTTDFVIHCNDSSLPQPPKHPSHLAAMQTALARLYTDAALRRRFYRDPIATCEELALTPTEAALLTGAVGREVSWYARSLQNKRMNEAANYIPATRAALSQDFAEYFFNYAQASSPTGVNKPLADALAFVNFLERTVPAGTGTVLKPWLIDLARYEAAWLVMRHSKKLWLVRRFQFRVDEFVRQLSVTDTQQPASQSFIGIWWRWRSRVCYSRLTLSSQRTTVSNSSHLSYPSHLNLNLKPNAEN